MMDKFNRLRDRAAKATEAMEQERWRLRDIADAACRANTIKHTIERNTALVAFDDATARGDINMARVVLTALLTNHLHDHEYHAVVDDCVIAFLSLLGEEEVAEAFDAAPRWFA